MAPARASSSNSAADSHVSQHPAHAAPTSGRLFASRLRESRDTSASVVSMSEAIDAAFCSAVRTTFVGSITPAFTRFS